MTDQTNTAETGTNNTATASIVEATKGVIVKDGQGYTLAQA